MYRVKIITKDKKHIFISETKNIKLAETCYNTIERIMHDYFFALFQKFFKNLLINYMTCHIINTERRESWHTVKP